ncbi:hypothetical protein IWQ62_000766 [Dispira parvispora]|uniref:Uncharacterized protein n=1 Tax=Dispira parvispora TaxID=1520584 RepID=A0A9W8AZE7_9FUNG|nr:hypothetical protein IWQ62_000766 [Dispira parvispora]
MPKEYWVKGANVKVTYTRCQLLVHLVVILVSALQYALCLERQPLWYSFGTLPSFCSGFVLLHHTLVLVTCLWIPRLVQFVTIFGTPFAYGCLWINTWFGLPSLKLAYPHSPPAKLPEWADTSIASTLSLSPRSAGWTTTQWPSQTTADDFTSGTIREWALNQWVPFALWWLLWVLRRNMHGIVIFQRSTQCSYLVCWIYRLYCLLCPSLVIVLWQWYPVLLATWNVRSYNTQDSLTTVMAHKIHLTPSGPNVVYMALVGVVAGISHITWYSFLSFSYHSVYWKTYLREGIVVWICGPQTVASKLT